MKRGLDRAAIGVGESVSKRSMSRLGAILLLAFCIATAPSATAQIALGSFVTLGSPADPPSIGTGAGVFDINPDRKKTDALLSHWLDLAEVDTAFICGPDGMMQAVSTSLQERGFPKSRIKIELFAASIPKHEHKTHAEPPPGSTECAVTAIIDGAAREFTLEKTKENIIDAALRQGIELPYSCKGGVCSTCRAKLVEGEVDMDVNFALEDYEVARGFVLCCQSYPVTDKVVVDFDQTA